MNKSKDLTSKKYGKLTVIEKSDSILGGDTIKRYWGTWKCLCDCGNIKIVKTVDLNKGSVASCGCLRKEFGISYKPGNKINLLTTISYKDGKWTCYCECGNTITVPTGALSTGNTKSCGCLKSEISKINAIKLIESRRQNEPRIASARRIWKSYCYRDNQCINFDDFMKISQQNCFYCGIGPSNNYNYFSTISSNSSKKAKEEGLFIYNGLDRIDSSKNHTIDNIVPCCYNCNRAKNNKTTEEFLEWVNNLQINNFEPIKVLSKELPENGSLATSIKCVFYNHKKDTDLTVEEYYFISQLNCFYCQSKPNNIFNRAKSDKKSSQKAKDNGDYLYNGIDRIDRSQDHNKNNIVPCCKYCNFAKSKLSIIELQEWIKRIKEYQKEKPTD